MLIPLSINHCVGCWSCKNKNSVIPVFRISPYIEKQHTNKLIIQIQ